MSRVPTSCVYALALSLAAWILTSPFERLLLNTNATVVESLAQDDAFQCISITILIKATIAFAKYIGIFAHLRTLYERHGILYCLVSSVVGAVFFASVSGMLCWITWWNKLDLSGYQLLSVAMGFYGLLCGAAWAHDWMEQIHYEDDGMALQWALARDIEEGIARRDWA